MKKQPKLLVTLSNGQGSQSQYLLYLISQGKFPATHSITADTGSEKENTWNTGERTSAEEYFNQVTKPFADKWGIDARFVRATEGRKVKVPLPSIEDWLKRELERARRGERVAQFGSMPLPLYGSNGGRLKQTCTDKWKIQALKQEARRLDATFVYSAQGIHAAEAWRRAKGVYYGKWLGFDAFHTVNSTGEVESWMMHCYPLVDLQIDREGCRQALDRLDIPYLVTSECDICPHQDKARWLRLSDERINELTELESKWEGVYWLTSHHKPLRQVINNWRKELPTISDDTASGCDSGFCFT